ncbi:MAG: DUF6370 family protein [Planctomycetota bacterium]
MSDHPIRLVLLPAILATLVSCQPSATAPPPPSGPATMEHGHISSVVEAACGQCQFGLPGSSCDLAVRINGNAYFVDGTGIDDHGDAHAAAGFCNTVRQARVDGELIDGRFAARSFQLLPIDAE